MRVFTTNFIERLAQANEACRQLRKIGFRVHRCVVKGGDSLEKSRIEVSGKAAHPHVDFAGCDVRRHIGGWP